ncbi:class I adenylate-forming enzyme family protein [Nonomuraea terrae]|uniref:class I adenylate-forming enzyme family protein n=1 Tax=Nonomuraea terrae TaxID=2530383 RepID=UPI0037902E3D
MTDTIASMLLAVAKEHGSREALVDGPRRLDYAAVSRRARAAAARLAALGVRPGDRVAVLLPNGWHHATGYLGIQLAGAIAVLVNTRFTTPEIEYVLRDSGARYVLTDDDLAARLAPDSVAEPLRVAEIVACTGAPPAPATPPGVARRPGDVAHLLYTSGTTGRPKGAMQTHANLLFNAGTVRERLGAAPGERTLIAAPMFHATGLVSLFVGFVSAGGCCVMTPSFHAATVLDLFVRERITVFAGVAAMLRLLLMLDDVDSADLSALRLFVMGGSPVPETFPAQVAERLPKLRLANVWGLTEATSIVTYVDGEEYTTRPWSVGRAVSGVELGISIDGAPPRDLRGQVGELCVRGPVVAAGYWERPGATAKTFAGGWLRTGDVGSVDADGYVRVLDRLNDMIIRGGENIYSLEVESVIAEHPDVADIAVVGVPDPLFDERVRAIVVPRPGTSPTAEELRAYAAARLADYKIPAEFRFVTELPRNPAGKVLKRRLSEEPDAATG